MRFEGQNVVVTGGTRGIGAAITRAFLREGAAVVATYRADERAAAALREAAGADAERLRTVACDVSDEAAVDALWEELDERPVEVLVNNAGVRHDALVAGMTRADWDAVLDVNLTGGFLMARRAVLNMLRARYGRIVFVTSPAGRTGLPGQGNYAASKAGQVGLARSLAKEVGRKGITANCVSPGLIETEFLGEGDAARVEELRALIACGRMGEPEEVAPAVLFLASREAGYVNGAVLDVDGGL